MKARWEREAVKKTTLIHGNAKNTVQEALKAEVVLSKNKPRNEKNAKNEEIRKNLKITTQYAALH